MITTMFRGSRKGVVGVFAISTYFSLVLASSHAQADAIDTVSGLQLGGGGSPSLATPPAGAHSPSALGNVDLATGAAQATYPFQFPAGRGDAQPALGLTYSSSTGLGLAGMGWTLDAPSIVRRGHSGRPRFQDALAVEPTFMLNGAPDYGTDDYYADGKLLIPVSLNPSLPPPLPTSSGPYVGIAPFGWSGYRAEVDDGARYFFDGLTWVKQTKSGHLIQFGVPLDGAFGAGVELADSNTANQAKSSTVCTTVTGSCTTINGLAVNPIYRWRIVRDTDMVGNTVYYSYDDEHQLFPNGAPTNGVGIQYLRDIYDTSNQPPTTTLTAVAPATTSFAHHVHLSWSLAQYLPGVTPTALGDTIPYAATPIWKAPPYAQLAQVDVTSATFGTGDGTARRLVRSYQLGYVYNDTQTRAFLNTIKPVGDCLVAGGGAIVEQSGTVLASAVTSCGNKEGMPPMVYTYFGISNSTTIPGTPPAPMLFSKTSAYGPAVTSKPEPGRLLADLDGDGISELVTGNMGLGRYNIPGSTAHSPLCTFQCQAASAFDVFVAWLGVAFTVLTTVVEAYVGDYAGAANGVFSLVQDAVNGVGPAQNCSGCFVLGPSTSGTGWTTPNDQFLGSSIIANGQKFQTVLIDDAMWTYGILGPWTSSPQLNLLDVMALPATANFVNTFTNDESPVLFEPAPNTSDGFGLSPTSPVSVGQFNLGSSVNLQQLSLGQDDITRLGYLNAAFGGVVCSQCSNAYPLLVADAIGPSTAMDLDGDGLPDVALAGTVAADANGTPTGSYYPVLSTRDRLGATHPFLEREPSICAPSTYDPKVYQRWWNCPANKTFVVTGNYGSCCDANKANCVAPTGCTSTATSVNLVHNGAWTEGMCCGPFGKQQSFACSGDLGTVTPTDSIRAFTDVDGDGVGDLVIVNKTNGGTTAANTPPFKFVDFETLVGRGDGRFGVPGVNPTSAGCASVSGPVQLPLSYGLPLRAGTGTTLTGAVAADPVGTTSYSAQQSVIRFGDLNGDGFADYAVLDPSGLTVCLRYGASWETAKYHCTADVAPDKLVGTDQSNTSAGQASLLIGDIDGSGVNQLLYLPPTLSGNMTEPDGNGNPIPVPTVPGGGTMTLNGIPNVTSVAVAVGTTNHFTTTTIHTEGLLKSISNGFGGSTAFDNYDTVAHLNLTQGTGALPVPVWVVKHTTTTNTAPAANGHSLSTSGQTVSIATSYDYKTPIYDPRDREFVGFRTTTVTNADTITTTTFATDTCVRTSTCGTPGADYSLYHASRGLPAVVDVGSNAAPSSHFTTRTIVSTFQIPYRGLDGRSGISPKEVDTATGLWPEGNTGNGSSSTLNPMIPPTGSSVPQLGLPYTAPPADPGTLVVRYFDGNGNLTSTVDYGMLGGGFTDQIIQTANQWNLPTPTDLSNGWNWRKTQVLTGSGSGALAPGMAGVREVDNNYDGYGRLIQVFAPITRPPDGTLTYGPAALPSRPVPAPCGSNDGCTGGHVLLANLTYDNIAGQTAWGNLIQFGDSMNASLATFKYDHDGGFHHLLTDRIYNSPQGPLDTSFSYDRGLGQVTSQATPAAVMTAVQLDDFGRVLEIDGPSPNTAGTTQKQETFFYDDAGPIRHVHHEVADGLVVTGTPATQSPAKFVTHDDYLDGLGETRATIDQVSGKVAEGTQLLLSGTHTSTSADGRLATAFVPVPWSGTLPTFGSGVLPSQVPPTNTPGVTKYTYDAIGRPTGATDVNMRAWAYTYNSPALQVKVQDQEQTTGGGHTAGYTLINTDGHGRTRKVTHHAASTAGSDSVLSYDSYLATGEPTSITYGGVNRTIEYDSLGRMAVNKEPNSGTWRYAYDFAGRLIGTSDQRGCGQNIYYDSMGRLVARDFIPCLPDSPQNGGQSQPPHTTLDLTNGNGTEAFYTYSPNGQLAEVRDLAVDDQFTYDPRGRLQKQNRKITAPIDSWGGGVDPGNGGTFVGSPYLDCSDIAPPCVTRYAENVFSRTFTYDFQDRVLTATTGATTPQITAMGNTETRSYSDDGRLQTLQLTGGTKAQSLITANVVTYFDGTSGNKGFSVGQAFGDPAATQASWSYGPDGLEQSYALSRLSVAPPFGVTVTPAATAADATQEWQYLINIAFTRDRVGNPTMIKDTATAAWPAGAKALTQNFTYDNSYRVTSASSNSIGDKFVPPTLAEQTAPYPNAFPYFETKSTGTTSIAARFKNETFSYDTRGNFTAWTDDINDFWDRSLGPAGSIAQGTSSTYAFGPDQLSTAAETPANAANWCSLMDASDAAGNFYLVDVSSTPQPAGSAAYYAYDEIGRLNFAQAWQPEHFLYADNGERIISLHNVEPGYTVYVFDSLVLHDASFSNGAYQLLDSNNNSVEQEYVGSGFARVFYDQASALPQVAGNKAHIFMTLPDGRGSAGVVIDHDSGEVVERTTYQPYGKLDADFRPARWNANYERHKFGDHWDNLEGALVYMGARYYSPGLGRFLTPDPMWIHGLRGDPNPYEFAYGNPIRNSDPDGLDPVSDVLTMPTQVIVGPYLGPDVLTLPTQLIVGPYLGGTQAAMTAASTVATAATNAAVTAAHDPPIKSMGWLELPQMVLDELAHVYGGFGDPGTLHAAIPSAPIQPYYPPNEGFSDVNGGAQYEEIPKGTILSRQGGNGSNYFSRPGTPEPMKALPYETKGSPVRLFRVEKPLPARVGPIEPAFGEIGGGEQILTRSTLGELLEGAEPYLVEIFEVVP